jgi:hypothetical protein
MNLPGVTLEPEQVLFGIGGLIRWTTLIPLAFVIEAKAKPLRELSLELFETLCNRLKIFCR